MKVHAESLTAFQQDLNKKISDLQVVVLSAQIIDLDQLIAAQCSFLVKDEVLVGAFFKQDDILFLQLNAHAPAMKLQGSTASMHLIVDAVNDLELQDIAASDQEVSINAANIRVSGSMTGAKVALAARETLNVYGCLDATSLEITTTGLNSFGQLSCSNVCILESNQMQLFGNVHVNRLEVICQQQFSLEASGSIHVHQDTSILAPQIFLAGPTYFGAAFFCKTDVITVSDSVDIDDVIYLQCLQLNLLSNASLRCKHYYEQSSILIHNELLVETSTQIGIKNLLIEAEGVTFKGNTSLNEVELLTDRLNFFGSFRYELNQCELQINGPLLLDAPASVWAKNSLFNANSIHLQGRGTVTNCQLATDNCGLSAEVHLIESKLVVSHYLKDQGATITQCDIGAEETSLYYETRIKRSHLQTNILHNHSIGLIDESKVIINNLLYGAQESRLTFKHSYLATPSSYSLGHFNFTDGSYYQSNYHQQEKHTLTANGSQITNTNLIYSAPNAQIVAESGALFEVQTALLSGNNRWQESQIQAEGTLIFHGENVGLQAGISSKKSILFLEYAQNFAASTVASDEQLITTRSLRMDDKSKISTHTFRTFGKSKLLNGSKLTASELNILGQFHIHAAEVRVQALNSHNQSVFELQESYVEAERMSLDGEIQAQFSDLHAISDVVFASYSQVYLHHVQINAGDKLHAATHSTIDGTKLNLKAAHFNNSGHFELDSLGIAAQSINNSGQIRVQEKAHYKASYNITNSGVLSAKELEINTLSLINHGSGVIHSVKNTLIQAPLIINSIGDIASGGRLTEESLFHLNLFASERAYDLTQRSLFGINAGLKLPHLPGSWNDVFNYQRLFSMGRTVFLQALPNYAHSLSFLFLAKNALVNGSLSIMELINQSERLDEVPAKIYHAALGAFNSYLAMQQYRLHDVSDLLPLSLGLMDNLLNLSQWKNSVLDVYQEWTCSHSYSGAGNTGHWSNTLGELAVSTYAPSSISYSYYAQNAGLSLSANIAQNSWLSAQSGFLGGWNVSHRTQKGTNRGILSGANLNVTATTYTNAGKFSSINNAALNINDRFVNQEEGELTGKNIRLAATQIENSGTMMLHEETQFVADKIVHHGLCSYTGNLQFASGQFELGAAANLISDKSQADAPTHLFIHADKAMLAGKIKGERATIAVKELEQVDDFISQQGVAVQQTFTDSLKLSTEQKVTLNTSIARDCDLTLSAAAIEINHEQNSKYDRNLKTTHQSLDIRKEIHAKNIHLESAQNVAIHGVTVQAEESISVAARKKVKLKSRKREYKGAFDTEIEYSKPKLIANAGNTVETTHDVHISAQDKLTIDGALIRANGDVILQGEKGVNLLADAHTYVDEKWKKKKKALGVTYSGKTFQHKETRTNVTDIAAGEKIIVVANEGQVKGVAGKFSSGNGTQIHAQKDVELKGLKTRTETQKQKTSFFGLNKKSNTERHEGIELVDFVAGDGPTKIFANQGDINAHDVRFKGKGDLTFAAPAGSIEVEDSTLKHLLETKERSVRFGSPLADAAKKWSQPDKLLKNTATTLKNTTHALANSEDPLAQMTTAVNTGIAAQNSLTLIQETNTPKQLFQNMGFVPKINVTQTQSQSSLNYETLSAGEIYQHGTVSFIAKEAIHVQGVPIHANNLYLEGKNVQITGQKLDFDLDTNTQSIQLGLGVNGTMDLSGSKVQHKVHKHHIENAVVTVNNRVTINAVDCQLQAANITCNTIDGRINHLVVASQQSESKTAAQNTSASTTGYVNVQGCKSQALTVDQHAGIHVRSDISAEEFKVDSAQLVGAAVTSDGYNGFAPEQLKVDHLMNYTDTRSYGFSGNIVEATKILTDPALAAEKDAQSHSLHTVNLAHGKDKYRSVSRATIFGKQGVPTAIAHNKEINSNSSELRQNLEHQQRHFNLDLPLEWVRSLLPINQEPQVLETINNQDYVPGNLEEQNDTSLMELDDAAPVASNPFILDEHSSEEQLMEIDEEGEMIEEESIDNADCLGSGLFNPKVNANDLGFKRGSSGKSKLYRTNNGQYTSVNKELKTSAKNSPSATGNVRLKLGDSGDSGEGVFYEAQLDSKNKKLRVNAELGKQYTFNLANEVAELGDFGQVVVAIDGGSLGALLKAKADSNASGIKLMFQAEAGVMGPSVSASYESSSISIMGLKFRIQVEGAGGIGYKAQGGAGFTADAKKAQIKAHVKLGLFSGLGGHGQINFRLGFDPEFSRSIERAMDEIVSKDEIGLHLIDKMKKQKILHGWEVDYFNDMMEQVSARAQAERWLGNQ
ncbi:MAG: hemagglutinin repeat-containing protein [Legionella sp.]|nr:hemagglutinin repeat-containing protein [Legionella sp.]